MPLKTVIAFVLLSLLSFNTLLSVTGGFMLHMHHDMSFHLNDESASIEEAHTSDSRLIEHHHHHHHELEVVVEMEPTLRSVDPWDKLPMPVLGIIAHLPNYAWDATTPTMASGFAARPPPDVVPPNLLALRTQVLRL